MFSASMKLEGVANLAAKIDLMVKAAERDRVIPIAKESAKMLVDEIKSRAPKGPTGNLKRSPKVKVMKGYPPLVLAAIDRKIAPHAHLLEFGTVKMSPHPFFRPAIDAKGDAALKHLHDGIGKNITKAAK